MSPRVRFYGGLVVLTLVLLVAVGALQWFLHVGSCGNGPDSYGPPCPEGTWWKDLAGALAVLVALVLVVVLPAPTLAVAIVLGLLMLAVLFAVLGFVPAPGEDPSALGLLVGLPFAALALTPIVRAVRRWN